MLPHYVLARCYIASVSAEDKAMRAFWRRFHPHPDNCVDYDDGGVLKIYNGISSKAEEA